MGRVVNVLAEPTFVSDVNGLPSFARNVRKVGSTCRAAGHRRVIVLPRTTLLYINRGLTSWAGRRGEETLI